MMTTRDLSATTVIQAVHSGLTQLFEHDALLFQYRVSEMAVAHMLASYLRNEFGQWQVDCEYNRLGRNAQASKKLPSLRPDPTCQNRSSTRVRPDIIVHDRTETGPEHNFLVIEVKADNNTENSACDIDKLRAFQRDLGYRYILFLRFRTRRNGVGILEHWSNFGFSYPGSRALP